MISGRALHARYVERGWLFFQARSGPAGALPGRWGVQGEVQPEGAAHARQQPHGAPGAHAGDSRLRPLGGESQPAISLLVRYPYRANSTKHFPMRNIRVVFRTFQIPSVCRIIFRTSTVFSIFHAAMLSCCGGLSERNRKPHTPRPTSRSRRKEGCTAAAAAAVVVRLVHERLTAVVSCVFLPLLLPTPRLHPTQVRTITIHGDVA